MSSHYEIKASFSSSSWNLSHLIQCKNCPWRKDSDLNDIPNYNRDLHIGLKKTIWDKSCQTHELVLALSSSGISMMSCHEASSDSQYICIGWLHNQLNQGNNIPLRIHASSCENISSYKIVGEQHNCFEDTIPIE